MFDYDRDIMQPHEEKEEYILANMSILDAGSIDMSQMKYRHIVERSKIACTQF